MLQEHLNIPDFLRNQENLKAERTSKSELNGEQFKCPCCGWRSAFEPEFIAQYKTKWEKNK